MNETTKPVVIETLMMRNFKRVEIVDVEFAPTGLTVIGGKNNQGKSTFLSGIQFLLGGKKYEPTQVANRDAGGASAVLRARLSNGIEVERTGKSSTLKVIVDGGKGNQGTLTEFLNEFALDVSKFLRAKEPEQAKMLIEHMGIGEKLDQLEAREKRVYDERTLAKRDVDRKRQLVDALTTYDKAPTQRVDVRELVERERALTLENTNRTRAFENLEHAKNDGRAQSAKVNGLKEQIEAKERELEAMRRQLADEGRQLEAIKTRFIAARDAADKMPVHDLTEIREQINSAESVNLQVDANAKAAAAKAEFEEVEKAWRVLDDTVTEVREQKAKLIEAIQMPLPGMGIADGVLTFEGMRWDCMSGSQRLRVATAISRAFKPDCGFVLVDELESMDWDTLREFDAWAKGEGIQIIGAMVCDEGKAGENVIIIEDGKVKG